MTEISSRSILLAHRGAYCIITLNRPAQFNCLTKVMMNELEEAIESLGNRNDLSSLIITGAGGSFSAGADLSEVSTLDAITAFDFSQRGQSLLNSLNAAAPVTVAAIDGYCLGGGLDIALSCDLRYATPRSTFQHPGVQRGIITGWGGTQRLARLIGLDATRRLIVSGERIDAEYAYRMGLINGIREDALESSCQFVERIAGKFTRKALLTIKSQFIA